MINKEIIAKNLDDAAIKYAVDNATYWIQGDDDETVWSKLLDAFKAGAEWMAAQGDIVETEPYFCTAEGDAEVSVPTTFKPNEKVIVQIRKKEE